MVCGLIDYMLIREASVSKRLYYRIQTKKPAGAYRVEIFFLGFWAPIYISEDTQLIPASCRWKMVLKRTIFAFFRTPLPIPYYLTKVN